jgi:valyl-tRNA synthetase
MERQIESYRFAEASETMYHAIWDDVADWYIEASKNQDNKAMLAWVLDTCLKIAHPFAPFVTETIWQTLPYHDTMIMSSKWPEKIVYDENAATEFSQIKDLITETRFVTAELPGNNRYSMLFQNDSLIENNTQLIQKMAKLKEVVAADKPRGIRLATSGREAWIDISADTLYEHQVNLEVRLAETHKDIAMLEGRLNNESYISKAPAKLVEETKSQLTDKKTLRERLQKELEVIN